MIQSKIITELNHLALKNELKIEALRDDNTIIICGAGISLESNLPSGLELLNGVLSKFNLGKPSKDNNDETDIDKINLIDEFGQYNEKVISKVKGFKIKLYDFPRLEVLFKCLKDVLSKDEYSKAVQSFLFFNYNTQAFNESVFSNYHHFAIADFIKNGGVTLTANFDNLIEHALTELEFELGENLLTFPLLRETTWDKSKGCLIKYHGDINDIETIGIDISNLRINGFNKYESKLLDDIFTTTKIVVFIGFSISDTLDLIPYLKGKSNNFNYIYFKWANSGKYILEEFEQNQPIKQLEAFEYFLNRYSNSYVLNNVHNEIQRKSSQFEISKNPAFTLSKSRVEELQHLNATLSNQDGQLHKTIKLNILKSYGLLNKIEESNLTKYLSEIPVSWKTIFEDYKKNINGEYKFNLTSLLKDQNQENFEFKHFSALQEYIFLQKGYLLNRIFSLIKLFTFFIKFQWKLYFFKGDVKQELKLNRSVGLFYLRLLQVFSRNKALKLVVPHFLLKKYESSILRQITLSKELNSLATFKFGLKEHLYIKGLYNHYFKKSKEDLIEELLYIFELNIDTNYFIEANNLLRFGATIIDSNFFEEPFITSTKLTNDKLNFDKVIISTETKTKEIV